MSVLARLAELEQQATPAPWHVIGPPWNFGEPWINAGTEDPHGGRYVCEFDSNSIADIDDENLVADAALIVKGRNALTALLEAAREAQRWQELARRAVSNNLIESGWAATVLHEIAGSPVLARLEGGDQHDQ